MNTLMTLLFNLNGWEIPILLIVILLLFGGKKIPELMHGIGKGIRSFKQGMKDVEDEIKKDPEEKK
jgi:sec-independent protein translocase protein TatA